MSIAGRLQALKKMHSPQVTTISFDQVVIGSDLYSLECFYQLKKKGKNACLVSGNEVSCDSLRPTGPTSLRGESNTLFFSRLYPHIPIEIQTEDNFFYKDSKWREFGGRSKPEKILDGEEFYIGKAARGNLDQAFECLQNDCHELRSFLSENVHAVLPQKIEREIEGRWNITLSNGTLLHCQELYWGLPPKQFTSLFTGQGEAFDHLIEYTDSTEAPASLYWRAEIPHGIISERQTLFIPQSYTHDWGHFIFEVRPQFKDKSDLIECLTFFSIDEISEEEVSKKIKAIKKSLEKVYPALTNQFQQEFLNFSELASSSHLNDQAFALTMDHYAGLFFIGENAAIAPLYFKSLLREGETAVSTSISHFLRGLISIRQSLI